MYFNLDEAEKQFAEQSSAGLLDEGGKYTFNIVSAAVQTRQAKEQDGENYVLQLRLAVADGPKSGRVVFDQMCIHTAAASGKRWHEVSMPHAIKLFRVTDSEGGAIGDAQIAGLQGRRVAATVEMQNRMTGGLEPRIKLRSWEPAPSPAEAAGGLAQTFDTPTPRPAPATTSAALGGDSIPW